MIPVTDAHHHIWRFDRTPWLQGPMQPRIFGDYEALRRDYPIEEFAADAATHGVTKSVYVQINVAPGDEVSESGWATEQGLRAGLIQAVTGFADLADPAVAKSLDEQMLRAPLRGIRQQLHWHGNPQYRFAKAPDVMTSRQWRRGLKEVGARGLHFELQVFENQYEHALDLVDAFPDITFVLLHAGMPEDHSAEGRKRWATDLGRFAERHNVLTKISGLGTFSHVCSFETWAPIIHAAVDIFSPARCLFGSNFPIEKLWTDYATLIATVRESLAIYGEDEQRAVLSGTADRLYRI